MYRSGVGQQGRLLTWLSREGKHLGVIGKPDQHRNLTLSPDEKTAALVVNGPPAGDAWIVDLATGASTPLTRDSKAALNPIVWSPDSQHVAVNIANGGIQMVDVASGKSTLVSADLAVEDWSPDGRSLLCRNAEATRLALLPLSPGSKAQTVLETPYRLTPVRLSPDGQWVVYGSTEAGSYEVFVASFPSFSAKKRVSTEGGSDAIWGKDGKAVYFRTRDSSMMSAEIRTVPKLEVGVPKVLFQWDPGANRGTSFGIGRDSQRFLVNVNNDEKATTSEIIMVLNWPAALGLQAGESR
jgi:Tol biopolymer transport system component